MLDGGIALYFALALAAALWIYGLRPFERYRLRHIPGPKPTWLVGNVHQMLHHGPHRTDLYFPQRNTPIFKVFIGANPWFIVEEPELARLVLLHSSIRGNPFGDSPMPHDRAQDSLMWIYGSKWRSLRNTWQPVFFSGSLKNYFGSMLEAAALLVEEVEEAAAEQKTVDIHAVLGDMTLQVVASAAFGVSLHTQRKDKSATSLVEAKRARRLREAAAHMFGPIKTSVWDLLTGGFPFLLGVFQLTAPLFPDKPLRTISEARQDLDTLIDELFVEHRAALKAAAANPNIHHIDASGTKTPFNAKPPLPGASKVELRKGVRPGSFIDLLIRGADRATGEAFSDSVMGQQALTMLLAGFETTGNTLAFACYLLARPCNAEKQAALTDEVDAFGRRRQPSLEDLDQLPYIDAVIKETMRMYPPGHTIPRVAERDMDLAGYKISKGDNLAVAAYMLQNSPLYWKDVDVFLPERWLEGHPESAKQPQPASAYIPFGEGPRACVGARFALQEAKLTLLRLFQKFTLELAPGQEPSEGTIPIQANITLAPLHGIHVKPSLRESGFRPAECQSSATAG